MIQSLTRAMKVPERLREADKSCSFAELSQMSGLPSSTVYRILQTSCNANYVSYDLKAHPHRLSVTLIPLGVAATGRLRLSNPAEPVLKDLMKIAREGVFLIIMSDYRGMILEEMEGPNPLKVIERFDNEVDLYYGGNRCALLAFQSNSFICNHTQEHLYNEPGLAPEEEEKLLSSLLRTYEEGVTTSRGEYIPNAMRIDTPVLDVNGKAVASIGLIAS